MINVALYQPKIPPNTGNIIRICANTGIRLNLIHPLGFNWDNKQLRRAGLDYAEFADIVHYTDWADFISKTEGNRRFIITTKGSNQAFATQFAPDDYLIFGSEDAGIEPKHMSDIAEDNWLRLPMRADSRSMNLSNAVAVMCYEALRQTGFVNLK